MFEGQTLANLRQGCARVCVWEGGEGWGELPEVFIFPPLTGGFTSFFYSYPFIFIIVKQNDMLLETNREMLVYWFRRRAISLVEKCKLWGVVEA